MAAWIQTYTGQVFQPLSPKPETINITDIAHALSMICRFNGHTRRFYSVAEHCVVMSQMVPPQYSLDALMHDAAEAYIADVARPIKPLLGGYKAIEDSLLAAIYHKYSLTLSDKAKDAIEVSDLRMLMTERQQLMSIHAPEWESLKDIEPYEIELQCWSPEEAEYQFYARFLSIIIGRCDDGQ